VLSLIKELPQFPESGRIVPEYNDKDLRERILGSYRIVYRIKREFIEIVAICHGTRQMKQFL
jgi:plasmid stabilization system protein ParE